FIRNLLVHLAEKILRLQPLKIGGDYQAAEAVARPLTRVWYDSARVWYETQSGDDEIWRARPDVAEDQVKAGFAGPERCVDVPD
ncbi:hypothetical protein ACN2XU_22755, partial [Primorskyibacter sp. 2E107]|uniref:hypothetical protein n=1 Tax=Primorskyibacter sp. 2E107 TaxID=3403458 RepID=UPI003AF544DC